uniref:Rab32 n=1 Tax=Glossina morsitans morsitans TaxID=37546 RepID=A0A1B0FIU8_GLOMM
MAAIVIRDVVVSLSTTKFSKTTTVNTQRTHRRTRASSSNLLCACLCDSTPTSSPYRLSAQRLLDSDNDTIDFRGSSTSTECSCENCPNSEYKFKSVETFSDDNISSSTAFEDSPVKKPNWPSFNSLKRYQNSSANLGVLKEIRSPIFAEEEEEEPKPSRGYSLRSQKPLYVKNLLIAQDSRYSTDTKTETETETANSKADTVVSSTVSRGVNMNENKQRIIPATITTITRGSVKSSNGTDINRNNGFARNGVSGLKKSKKTNEIKAKKEKRGESGKGGALTQAIGREEEKEDKESTYTSDSTGEATFRDKQHEVVVTTEKFALSEPTRKFQITISAKKIETTKSAEVGKQPTETDYLTPLDKTSADIDTTTDSSSTQLNTVQTDLNSVTKKKKLKAKGSSCCTANISPAQTVTQTQKTNSAAQIRNGVEKFVITQSAKDTPPKERAPSKPSRLINSSTSQAAAASGAILTTITAIEKSNNNNKTISVAQEPSSVTKSEEKQRLEFPTLETQSEIPQTIEQPQPQPALPSTSSVQEEQPHSLQPPDYPPPPPPPPPPPFPIASNRYPTPEIRSPTTAHRYTSLSTTSTDLNTDALEKNTIKSVASIQISTADDQLSLAESSHQHIDSEVSNESKISSGIDFALGSPVRPPPPIDAIKYSFDLLHDQHSYDFNRSEDSDTHTPSEHIRRRIHYVSQPTLCDDFTSLEGKRANFRYQSGVSDLSLDSIEDLRDDDDDDQLMPAFGDLTMDQDMEPTIQTLTSAEKREHLYKILVIGELGTGKTSFIKRYVHQFFSQNYRATIGVDFALKVLHWDPNTIVRLQLWDIAGQERFGNMTRVYYKEAVGAFIVFDVTRSGTFDCVSKWKEDLDSKVQLPDGTPIPCILLANKCDQEKQGIVTTPDKMEDYVKENGFAGWFETSAKENINIDEAARALVNKILLNDKLISAADLADGDKFNLNSSGDQSAHEAKSKCSC